MGMIRSSVREVHAVGVGVGVDGGVGEDTLHHSVLALLTPESRQALLGLGVRERLPRGSAVYGQGEVPRRVLLVASGRVRLERVADHGPVRFAVGHRGPGQLVGERALGGAETHGESAIVADEVHGVSFSLAPLRARIAEDGALRAALASAIVEDNHAVEERLEGLLVHGVDARLVLFLLDAKRRWGVPAAHGVRVEASFTHAEIAAVIGATRETVTLALGKLKREGLVDFDRRRIVVVDPAGLERLLALRPSAGTAAGATQAS
jgi:CRP-like cAMP-binding protein